jgi:phosphohistidine phosphatase SixA
MGNHIRKGGHMLILVRHGPYKSGGTYLNEDLSEIGRLQIVDLATKLSDHVSGKRVTIVHSPSLRTTQTAEILSRQFRAPMEPHGFLWSGMGGEGQDFAKAHALIRTLMTSNDVVIVVTHYEYVEGFPSYFGFEELGVSNFPTHVIDKGHAWVIDCDAKTCVVVSP